ncbi:hypothetical protein [Streptomyces sp. NBC_00893]|uniref:hypothetical protein n=1 Tax=Streptomyces sp. NBC_00893 TaxID=2975862 RepID=UPI002258897A|nr:hypothetical protein [Streptomyces sp. NBC_00893]MCX4846935.1 hypothetical protein [Streptomyces sp. NBC_00893]
MSDEPSPETVRRLVTRGRGAGFDVPEGEASATTRRLNQQLAGQDIRVFVSGPTTCTALQLVDAHEARRTRPELETLIADFRGLAHTLTETFELDTLDENVWWASPHGEHCRFENLETGVIVEAHIHAPDSIDPYFLLRFAETTGRYPGVLDACVHGFHDMSRLLEMAGVQ